MLCCTYRSIRKISFSRFISPKVEENMNFRHSNHQHQFFWKSLTVAEKYRQTASDQTKNLAPAEQIISNFSMIGATWSSNLLHRRFSLFSRNRDVRTRSKKLECPSRLRCTQIVMKSLRATWSSWSWNWVLSWRSKMIRSIIYEMNVA